MPMHLSLASWFSSATLMLMLVAVVGCSRSDGQVAIPRSIPTNVVKSVAEPNVVPVAAVSKENNSTELANGTGGTDPNPQSKSSAVEDNGSAATTDDASSKTETPATTTASERQFKVEGPEGALRISFDDFDLLKILNLDPVPPDAPERLPKWLKDLDGKRIRVRGFMYPPFQDTDIRGFVLARDNQICCFGRTPKEYDLVEVFLRKGKSTHYIQNRPFDVVGVFRIKSEIEKYTAMYELEDALVIEK
jgi:hypothetical protein